MNTTKAAIPDKFQTNSNKLFVFLEMIKFEHTLFALPFAYTAALLTAHRIPSLYQLLWITVAMVGARTAAMSFNRLIDRHIDAANPRTAGRALPQGLLAVSEMWLYIILSLTLLAVAAVNLSPLAVTLFPVVLFFLTFYSYTKRFTWLCHFFLGATLGLAPLCAWAALANEVPVQPLLLAIGVTIWVAGFDIIYACDDYSFDKKAGIFSIPARFGITQAFWIARALHLLTPVFFILVGQQLALGLFYWLGLAAAMALLAYQHCLIQPQNLAQTGAAFMQSNGIISVIIFLGTLLDVLFPLIR